MEKAYQEPPARPRFSRLPGSVGRRRNTVDLRERKSGLVSLAPLLFARVNGQNERRTETLSRLTKPVRPEMNDVPRVGSARANVARGAAGPSAGTATAACLSGAALLCLFHLFLARGTTLCTAYGGSLQKARAIFLGAIVPRHGPRDQLSQRLQLRPVAWAHATPPADGRALFPSGRFR